MPEVGGRFVSFFTSLGEMLTFFVDRPRLSYMLTSRNVQGPGVIFNIRICQNISAKFIDVHHKVS